MIIVALVALTLSSTATAGAPPVPPTPPAVGSPDVPPVPPSAPVPPVPPFAPVDDDGFDRLSVPWTERSGTGVAFGYENGSWGGAWAQSVRVQVPFNDYFAANVRGVMVFGAANDFGDRVDLGARVELIGRSPVMLNVVRLYGGGGVQVFGRLTDGADKAYAVGGGGGFGFEFFLMPSMSWILEVGGQSGVAGGEAGGATIMAGLQLYPF